MAKVNNSDYSRWAKRKSTAYLKEFFGKWAVEKLKTKLLGEPYSQKPIRYLDRKFEAAKQELLRREAIAATEE